jgi:hypothetical protein
MECPHPEKRDCPLYRAMHGGGGGCDDGRLDEGGCAVSRGMDYSAAVAALRDRVIIPPTETSEVHGLTPIYCKEV